jgi:hypothetical protein
MSQDSKRESSANSKTPPRGVMSIPKGEMEDMKRELKRVTRKPREEKPQTPKD